MWALFIFLPECRKNHSVSTFTHRECEYCTCDACKYHIISHDLDSITIIMARFKRNQRYSCWCKVHVFIINFFILSYLYETSKPEVFCWNWTNQCFGRKGLPISTFLQNCALLIQCLNFLEALMLHFISSLFTSRFPMYTVQGNWNGPTTNFHSPNPRVLLLFTRQTRLLESNIRHD